MKTNSNYEFTLRIYNKLCDKAERFFEEMKVDGKEYTVGDINKQLFVTIFINNRFDYQQDFEIEVGTFKCSMNYAELFKRLSEFEKLIKKADRRTFAKQTGNLNPVVSFAVPNSVNKLVSVTKNVDYMRSVMQNVYFDVKASCLVSCDGIILNCQKVESSVFVVDKLQDGFLIPADLLSKGAEKIVILSDSDGRYYVSNKKSTVEHPEGRYPMWRSVLNKYWKRQGCKVVQKELEKTIKSVCKIYDKKDKKRVKVRTNLEGDIVINSAKSVDNKIVESKQTIKVKDLFQDFEICISADYVKHILPFNKMFIESSGRPITFVGDECFSMMMPVFTEKESLLYVNMEEQNFGNQEEKLSTFQLASINETSPKESVEQTEISQTEESTGIAKESDTDEISPIPTVIPKYLPTVVPVNLPAMVENKAITEFEEIPAVAEDAVAEEIVEVVEEIQVAKKRRSKEELAAEEKFVIVTNSNGDQMRARLLKISEKKGTANCLFKGHNRFSVPISQISDTEDQTSGFTLPEWLKKGSKITSDGISFVIIEKVSRSSVSCVESPEIKLRDILFYYRPYTEIEKKESWIKKIFKKIAIFSF